MITYEIGRPGDEADIVDFGNFVFSQAHEPHDFKLLLPKVYGEGQQTAGLHFLARDDSRIRAMVAMLPGALEYRPGGALKYGFIGTVSVHPYARGEGHMKKLMAMAIDEAKARGYDFMILGGQRQRYQYFGFDQAGAAISMYFDQDNARHALKNTDDSQIRFLEIKEKDETLIDQAYALYLKLPIASFRDRGEFLTIMHSWQCVLYAIMDKDRMRGYVYASDDGINEIALEDEALLYPLLKRWLSEHDSVKISVFPWDKERIRALRKICGGYSMSDCDMIRVLNWPRFLQAAMTFKASLERLPDGRAAIEIGDERVLIEVKDGVPSVSRTDEEPEVSLSALDAQEMFFAPLTYYGGAPACVSKWLPLPFTFRNADGF